VILTLRMHSVMIHCVLGVTVHWAMMHWVTMHRVMIGCALSMYWPMVHRVAMHRVMGHCTFSVTMHQARMHWVTVRWVMFYCTIMVTMHRVMAMHPCRIVAMHWVMILHHVVARCCVTMYRVTMTLLVVIMCCRLLKCAFSRRRWQCDIIMAMVIGIQLGVSHCEGRTAAA